MSSNEPVKNGCEVIYEMFHILNCDDHSSFKICSSIYEKFHISLHREHIVTSFHPFLKTGYERMFTQSKLADKPKP